MASKTTERAKLVAPDGKELRVSTAARIEIRAEGDKRTLVGHAAVFDQWTTLYQGKYLTWREMVRPGAFARALAEKQDVRALVNHDSDQVLGRTASGTCRLREDQTGLYCEIDPPDTQTARDLMTLVGRGDISGMSIGFCCKRDTVTTETAGDMETDSREVLDVDLFDVSIVTFPAYPQTDIALRSVIEERDRPRRSPCWLARAKNRLRLAAAE